MTKRLEAGQRWMDDDKNTFEIIFVASLGKFPVQAIHVETGKIVNFTKDGEPEYKYNEKHRLREQKRIPKL